MKRLWLVALAAGAWAACDVVSNLGDDGLRSCDGGVCPDGGAPDAARDAGDSGPADSGSSDSGFNGGRDGGDGGCDSASCLGCCAGNTCIGYSSETSGQCGASGAACAPCGADVCDSGVCVPPVDSGHPDSGNGDAGCGPGTCNGCCNLTQCVMLLNETNLLCGNGGAACLPCSSDAGTCNTATGMCG
jgi:hypothetical protein